MKLKHILFATLVAASSFVTSCCVSCSPPRSTNVAHVSTAEILQRKTVALVSSFDDGTLGAYCSGVWIGNDKIITAAHCVEQETTNDAVPPDPTGKKVQYVGYDAVPPSMDVPGDRALVAVVSKWDHELDLAVITATKPPRDHYYATVSTQELHVGERVDIVGHTVGLWFSYVSGNISAFRTIDSDSGNSKRRVLQISSAAWFGNSGGGAFNKNGEIIGIASFILKRAPLLTFFTSRDDIVEFFHKTNIEH